MSDWLNSLPGAVIAILVALIGGFGAKRYADYREAKGIKAALAAELRALLDIVDNRKYFESIGKYIESIKGFDGNAVLHEPMSAKVDKNYQMVFAGVVDRIGLLQADLAAEVVAVHYYIQAFLEDLKISSTAKSDPTCAWILRDYATLKAFYNDFLAIGIKTRERIRTLINQLDPPKDNGSR
jgi:hypothetical protein